MENGALMDQLRQRLKNGDVLRTCAFENGQYVVHLTKDPPLSFGGREKDAVNRILHELNQI